MPGASAYPAVFLVVAGSGIAGTSKSMAWPRRTSMTLPEASTSRRRSTQRRVEPKRKLREPLALVAMVPPTAAAVSVGSGG